MMKKKKAILMTVLALILLTIIGTAIIFKINFPGMTFARSVSFDTVTNSLDKFLYQPEKIEKGTVYHYIKSNINGSKSCDVFVYIQSEDFIEVFKIYPGTGATYYVTAEFDWDRFSPRILKGYEIDNEMKRTLVVHGFRAEDDVFTCKTADGQYTVPIGHYPFHNFNFDFTSLNYSFRHLVEPECEFEIGVHYPAFSFLQFIKLVYPGKATIRYTGDEPCHGRDCRKYEISGPGMLNKKGYIWVNKDGEYFENIEIPLADNPGWKDFKFTLQDIGNMSQEEWDDFIVSKTNEFFSQ